MTPSQHHLLSLRALFAFSRVNDAAVHEVWLEHVWTLVWSIATCWSVFCHLEVQHVTSDKQAPSALDYFAAISAALSLERRMAKPGQSKALKDLLTAVVGSYNKMCTSKQHRINSGTKAMLYNLFLVSLIWTCFSHGTFYEHIPALKLSKASSSHGTGQPASWSLRPLQTWTFRWGLARLLHCQFLSPTHAISMQVFPWNSWRRISGFQDWPSVQTAPSLLASNNGGRSSIPQGPRCCCGFPDWSRSMFSFMWCCCKTLYMSSS